MRIYSVSNGQDYCEDFYSLPAAKKAMKEHNAKGFITVVRSNGDWEPMGEIKLKGSNASMLAGATKQTTNNYN